MSTPIAVASIPLSDEQRKRIAAELGLGADELAAVPTKLEIARYEVADDSDDEVGGFAFATRNPPNLATQNPIAGLSAGLYPFNVGKRPGSILIPV